MHGLTNFTFIKETCWIYSGQQCWNVVDSVQFSCDLGAVGPKESLTAEKSVSR